MRKILLWIVLIGFVAGCDVYLSPPRRSGLPPGHGGRPPGHGGIPPGQAKKMGPPSVYIPGRPNFVRIPGTNVRVMVGVDAYIFRIKGVYYYAYGGRWYRSRHFRGPWNAISSRNLPPALRGRSPRKLKAQAKKRKKKKSHRRKHHDD